MQIFTGNTFAEAYKDSLIHLKNSGLKNEARGTTSLEVRDVTLVISDPRSCLYTNEARSSQIKYISAEFLWYYMGRNDVEFISKYAKFWESIQNPDGTLNSAYGNLIFIEKVDGISQYEWALQSLVTDPNTRQAVMHFNKPKHQYRTNKDFVCTMYANFHIRENLLHMSVFMRSNDVILGTPTDVAFFCSLQLQMLSHLQLFYPELKLGTYTHVANSYHVYDRHYDLLDKMLDSEFKAVNLPPIKLDLINVDGSPISDFAQLFDHINTNSKDVLLFQDGNDLYKWIYTNLKK